MRMHFDPCWVSSTEDPQYAWLVGYLIVIFRRFLNLTDIQWLWVKSG